MLEVNLGSTTLQYTAWKMDVYVEICSVIKLLLLSLTLSVRANLKIWEMSMHNLIFNITKWISNRPKKGAINYMVPILPKLFLNQ